MFCAGTGPQNCDLVIQAACASDMEPSPYPDDMEPGSGRRQVVLLASGCCPVRPARGARSGAGGGEPGEEAACAAAVMAACAPTGAAACFEAAAAQPACAALLAGPRDDARLTCAAPAAARAVSYPCAAGCKRPARMPHQQRPARGPVLWPAPRPFLVVLLRLAMRRARACSSAQQPARSLHAASAPCPARAQSRSA